MSTRARWGIRSVYLFATASVFIVSSVILVALVLSNMRGEALREAEEKSFLIEQRNLAIHKYFATELKPPLLNILENDINDGYFDQTWMSSSYAIRQINHLADDGSKFPYYYKEAVVNARSPQNEADDYEKDFLVRLNKDPGLEKQAGVRMIGGVPYYFIMRRGEKIDASCLKCHGSPADAPSGMLKVYGDKRGFNRREGETVSALSVRVPLSSAFASNKNSLLHLCLTMVALSGASIFMMTLVTNKTLITPIRNIENQITSIPDDRRILSEEIPLEGGRELQSLIRSFNSMERELRQKNENMEELVRLRTMELSDSNRRLLSEIEDRKKTELELVSERNKLKSIIEAMEDGLTIRDRDYNLTYQSDLTLKLFGSRLGEKCYKVFSNRDELCEGCPVEKAFKDGKSHTLVKETILPNGESSWWENTANAIMDSNGEITSCLEISRNITEKKNAERDLHEMKVKIGEQEVYSVLVEMAADGFWLLDKNFITKFVNPAIEKMLGYGKDEMVGRSWYDFGDPEWVARAKELEKRRESGVKEPHEFMFIHKTGRKILTRISTTPLYDADGNFDGALGILSDITKQHEAEEALKVKEVISTISNASGIGMFLLNPDFTIAWCNELYGKWFAPLEHIKGRNCYEAISGKDSICANCPAKDSFDSGDIIMAERFGITTSEGADRIISMTTSPITDDDGTVLQVVAIVQDITDRKKAEELQRHAQEQEKHAVVGKIAGKMAHDFNNILGIIMGTGALLLSDDHPQELKEEIEIVMESARKGRDLTRNLLLFAKDQDLKMTQFDLNDKITALVKSMKADLRDVEVTLDLGSGLESLIADEGLLENALINLVQNSSHAMGLTEKPALKIATRVESDMAVIEIHDNGCGIPEEHRNKIYDPAFTLKGSGDATGAYPQGVKGSGYGMANVKRCVDKHGGKISFTSSAGEGTVFTIRLPMMKGHFTTEEIQAIREQIVVEGKNILIVEDEPHIGKILCSMLKVFNHNIDYAENGSMALKYLMSKSYDVICLDYLLPDMNGLELYLEVRKTDAAVPIIFVSGNFEFMQSMIDLKKKDPNVDHIAKPFEKIEYVNKVHEWLV